MAPEIRDWSVPAPLRALLWWPGVSFALVLLAPDLAAPMIAAAGLALVALGVIATRPPRATPVGTADQV